MGKKLFFYYQFRAFLLISDFFLFNFSKYVAANRGSVHVAPLVGHIQSVKSSNVQPAPGTTW